MEVAEQFVEQEEQGQENTFEAMDDEALDQAINEQPEDAGETPQEQQEEAGPTEEASEADAGPEQQDQEQVQEQPADELSESLQKAQKIHEEDQAMIARQSNELGKLRQIEREFEAIKQTLALQQEQGTTDKDLNEKFFEDPSAALQQALAIERQKEQAQYLERLEREKQVRTVQGIDDMDFRNDVVTVAKEVFNEPEEVIAEFKDNPYVMNPFAVRAYAEIANRERTIASLNAKISELEKKPSEVARKISQAANTPPKLGAATGQGGGGQKAITSQQLSQLSDTDLEAFLSESS